MGRKTFLTFLTIQVFAFLFGFTIKYYQPVAQNVSNIKEFPLYLDGWVGQKDDLVPEVVDMLNPTEIFSATYTNQDGTKIHLFFDYFAGQSSLGGPHSPRNCMPGSGWAIEGEEEREIQIGGRIIKTGRFNIRFGDLEKVMDFWYLTRYGETSNDYVYKFYTMISALTFRTNDIVFIRILGDGDEKSLEALDEFEKLFVDKIYNHFGFN